MKKKYNIEIDSSQINNFVKALQEMKKYIIYEYNVEVPKHLQEFYSLSFECVNELRQLKAESSQ